MHALLSPFVGRSHELDALDALAVSGSIWIWGPPGVGKSRVAYEWFSRSEAVVTVDLSSCASPEDFARRLEETLGLSSQSYGPAVLEALRDATREADCAVILDNADRVRGVVESFASAGVGRLIVTCRSAPSSDAVASLRLDPLDAAAAAALFESAARAYGSNVSHHDPELIGRLLERLDGLPIALEFAAHRTRLLSLEEQLLRLESGTGVELSGLDWMWDELRPQLRTLVVQCWAFPDGFTAAAIEATAALQPGVDALELLDELLTSCWLQRSVDVTGGYRFRLLHALRDFAEAATPRAELDAANQRALQYWFALAPTLRAEAEDRLGERALQRLEAERENLLSSVERGLAVDDPRALVVLESLRWNACLIGPAARYAALVDQGRQRAGRDEVVAARFLDFAAELARLNGNVADSARDARAALEFARAANNESLIVRAEVTLAAAEADSAPTAHALTRLHDACRRAEDLGDHLTRAAALVGLGRCHLRNLDSQAAEECFRDALNTYRAYANEMHVAECLTGLAAALLAAGRSSEAEARLVAALGETSKLGLATPFIEYNLAIAQHACGELDAAAERIEYVIGIWTRSRADGRLPGAWIAAARIYWDLRDARALEAARHALRSAQVVGDRYHEGVATGLVALFTWAGGTTVVEDDLSRGLATLQVYDPLLAAVHLVSLVGWNASIGSSAQVDLARAAKIVDAISSEHEHLYTAGQAVLGIGRAFGHLCDAGRASTPLQASSDMRQLATNELEAVAGSLADVSPPASFYVRLLADLAWRLLGRLSEAGFDLPDGVRHDVEFHINCHWVRVDRGAPIDLSSRKQLRVIVKALARRHFMDPAALSSVEELLQVGWPGEVMTPTSGRSRIYTAVRELRKMGLDALIVTEDGGYRLAWDIRFRVADPTGILAPD